MSSNNSNINAVFYAQNYHPIQAGSIDGTDILPHDNAVYRALLCSSAGLYDPFGDPKVIGAPYCTLFVGHLSPSTTEDTLLKCMRRYGRVKNLRLVRDIVTGASRGYAFVEFETEREMRQAYEDAHHSYIDDSEIIVDYNRQQLMAGWIPRRLGGGLGGKKESGQLRFGGRERPFRAPRPIPYEDLKRLGIPPPPEERYMSRFQVPPPPRSKRSSEEREDSPHRREKKSEDREVSPSRRKWGSKNRDVTQTRRKGTSSRRERETPSPGRKRYTEEREASLPRTKRKSEGRVMSPSRRNRDCEDREMTPTRRKRSSYDRGISPPRRERHSKERETLSPKRKRSSGKRDTGNKNDQEDSHQHRRPRGRNDLSE